MRNAGDVTTILCSLLHSHICIYLRVLVGNQVANQVLDEEKGDREESELEVVHLIVIRCLEGRIIPPPVGMDLMLLMDRCCRMNLAACHYLKISVSYDFF